MYTIKNRKLLLCVVVLGLWGFASQVFASTVLSQLTDYDEGSYEGAYWKLSDGEFDLTGDALAQSAVLDSVTFKHDANKTSSSGDLYLVVFTGDTGGMGTFVGASTNAINVAGSAHNAMLTWTFSGITLDKDTTYSYVVSHTDTAENPDEVMGIVLGNGETTDELPTGSPLVNDASADPYWDPYLVVNVSNVPEPATLGLLLAGSGLAFLRRRSR
jgi:hypothetical protein